MIIIKMTMLKVYVKLCMASTASQLNVNIRYSYIDNSIWRGVVVTCRPHRKLTNGRYSTQAGSRGDGSKAPF